MTDDARPIKANAGKRAPSPERVAAFQTGISAESRACVYLIAKGYRILARRFKTPHGEIDIVARRRGLLAFVEVKARATLDNAAYSVTPRRSGLRHMTSMQISTCDSTLCSLRPSACRAI